MRRWPAPPVGATNIVVARRFQVLLPGGTTREVAYDGLRATVQF
jgi:hypothetical protein